MLYMPWWLQEPSSDKVIGKYIYYVEVDEVCMCSMFGIRGLYGFGDKISF